MKKVRHISRRPTARARVRMTVGIEDLFASVNDDAFLYPLQLLWTLAYVTSGKISSLINPTGNRGLIH